MRAACRARHGRGQGQLDPGPAGRALAGLLDDRHPLAAHPGRGQHGVGTLRGRRPLGHPDQRRPPAADVPVLPPGPSRPSRCPEHGLLERCPRAGVRAPRPEPPGSAIRGPRPSRASIQRPAERGLPDDVARVPGHALGHVGPAGDHRERLAVLQHGHAVAFLQPQRAQRGRVQRRPPAAGAWCAPRASPGPGRSSAWPGPRPAARRRGWRSRSPRPGRRRRARRRPWSCRRTRPPPGGCRRGSRCRAVPRAGPPGRDQRISWTDWPLCAATA